MMVPSFIDELEERTMCLACEGHGFITLDSAATRGDFGPDFDYCPTCPTCRGTGEYLRHPQDVEVMTDCPECGGQLFGGVCCWCSLDTACGELAADCRCQHDALTRFDAAYKAAHAFID